MFKYKNNGGQHVGPDGKAVNHGEEFTTEESNLCERFPGKFTLLTDAADKAPDAGDKAPEPDKAPTGTGKSPEAPNAAEDVTSDFPEAEEADLVVLKEGGKWNIYDGDPANEDNRINEKPLLKREVGEQLAEYLGE